MKKTITLNVNGRDYDLVIPVNRTLTQVLRENLKLTGTKHGCSVGDCGSCTVLMDGEPVNSCLVLAVEAEGRQIQTIEGLAEDGKLHPVQQAFVEKGGIQCGFCSPGMILTAKSLLDKNPSPTESEIREAISGNLCRCTGYQKIVEAIESASRK
jgi:aerobic-type carbon monoxide dehydrogenase small subunit (CoxS/CutS family)